MTHDWDTYSVIGGFKMLLNQSFRDSFDLFTFERVSDETVNDIDCYVLFLNATSNITNENIDGYHYGNRSSNIEDTFWIAKQTKYLMKAEINSLTDASGAYAMGWPTPLRSITTVKMTIDFNDYNEPVTIMVPSEAKDHWY